MTKSKRVSVLNDISRYQIDGWHIIDTVEDKRIYVRALIEHGCCEFNDYKALASKRLKIIDAIGEERIFALMREVYAYKGRAFIEGIDGVQDIKWLREDAKKEMAMPISLNYCKPGALRDT